MTSRLVQLELAARYTRPFSNEARVLDRLVATTTSTHEMSCGYRLATVNRKAIASPTRAAHASST